MITGVFQEKDGGRISGTIQTLFFRADKVVFEPLQRSTPSPNAPTYRIYTGSDLEIGAAWMQSSKDTGEISLSVVIDDPTLATPIRCGLARSKDHDGRWLLIWNRAAKDASHMVA